MRQSSEGSARMRYLAQPAFVYRPGAENERQNAEPLAWTQPAFVYRPGAEKERRFRWGAGTSAGFRAEASGG
jgi:hypothetical protein